MLSASTGVPELSGDKFVSFACHHANRHGWQRRTLTFPLAKP